MTVGSGKALEACSKEKDGLASFPNNFWEVLQFKWQDAIPPCSRVFLGSLGLFVKFGTPWELGGCWGVVVVVFAVVVSENVEKRGVRFMSVVDYGPCCFYLAHDTFCVR